MNLEERKFMTFSKEYYAAKKEVAEIDKQLESPQAELDKKETEKKQLLKNAESLKCSQKQDKRTLDTNILSYMKDKIRKERNGEKFILIEEDPVIADYNEKYKVSMAEKDKKIETVNESIASLDGEITKLKGKISVLKEKRKKPEAVIEREDAEYEEEIRLRVELRRLEEQYDSYSSYDNDASEDSYFSYGSLGGSSKSYSSYDYEKSYSSYGSSYEKTKKSTSPKSVSSYTPSFKPTTKTWFLVKRNGKNQCIEVEHYTNNGYAAKRDMMSLYGISSSDIVTSSSGSRNPWPTLPCNHFDGTNSH